MSKRIGFWAACAAFAAIGCGGGDGGRTTDAGDTGPLIMLDGGTDTGPRTDAMPDTGTGTDAGTDMCGSIGRACTPERGCPSGECVSEFATAVGGADDPIRSGPGGAISVPVNYWIDGYCTPVLPSAANPYACDPDDELDTTCGACGSCVDLGSQALCFRTCEPAVAGRGDCRPNYECNLNVEVCFPGCTTDDECKITRENTNGIEGIQTPDDCLGDAARAVADQVCGGDESNFDALVYDPDSASVCNPATSRCTNPGTAGAQGGDTCEQDIECEAEGRCLDEATYEWPGGGCTKFRCDLAGNDCAGDAVCQDRRLGIHLCLEGCTVAAGADATDPTTWLDNTGGCRDGYACMWNGTDGAGVANNGACVPGEFNDITDNNIGQPCTEDSECWSPFGQGICFTANDDGTGFVDGYCTMLDCQAPGMPSGICGDGNLCVTIQDDITACFTECTTADDCREGYACSPFDDTRNLCLGACGADTECRTGETCVIPAGDTFGTCQ